MGQKIEVEAESHGDVAVFATDRTVTGQDGSSFTRATTDGSFEGQIAERLFRKDPAIEHVFVQFNIVSARRSGGWDDGSLRRASEQIEQLFLVY